MRDIMMRLTRVLLGPAISSFAFMLSLALSLLLGFFVFVPPAAGQQYIFGRADFPVGSQPVGLAVGDFNGDGKLDLAVVNSADNTVSILLGKPDGTFAKEVTYSTGKVPVAVAIGDFNGDGNLDLAVANKNCQGSSCGSGSFSILLGEWRWFLSSACRLPDRHCACCDCRW
jgi:FG-GAP-like repeat